MSAKERVAARGYQYRLILEKPVPRETCDALNTLWRERWGNDAFTPNLSLSGKVLYGSFTNKPVEDLLAHGFATREDVTAVGQAVWKENQVMQKLFEV